MEWTGEDRPCPVCNSREAKQLGSRGGAAHREGQGVETTVVRCRPCGSLYTRPTLLPVRNPYDSSTTDEYFSLQDSERKIANGREMARFAASVLGRTGRMLEVGCGRGDLLRGAAAEGWEVAGVEMTEGFAESARAHGVSVECAPVESCESLNGKYDVILLAAVLEHLYEPAAVLRRVSDALVPGGLLFVDVPNEASLTMRAGNLYMRLRGRAWSVNLSPTFPPYHVVGFSPASLRFALESAGLRVHRMEVQRWANDLPRGGLARSFERAGLELVQRVGSALGMGDGIACWARKV